MSGERGGDAVGEPGGARAGARRPGGGRGGCRGQTGDAEAVCSVGCDQRDHVTHTEPGHLRRRLVDDGFTVAGSATVDEQRGAVGAQPGPRPVVAGDGREAVTAEWYGEVGDGPRNGRHGGDALGERGVDAGALGKRRGDLVAVLAAAHDAPGELVSGDDDRGVGIPHRLHICRHAGLHHRGAGHHDRGGDDEGDEGADERSRTEADGRSRQPVHCEPTRARASSSRSWWATVVGVGPVDLAGDRAAGEEHHPVGVRRSDRVVGHHDDGGAELVDGAPQQREDSSAVVVSSAPVGSSAKITSGSVTSARAMATRCCWPPDSWAGRRRP